MDGQAHRHSGRLSVLQRTRVRTDVAQPPGSFGYSEGGWTGALLSRHLRDSHRIALGERQCRRLLSALGISPGPRRRNLAAPEPVCVTIAPCTNSSGLARRPISGAMRRELALRKIRRLASSGLPLYPFVLTLFDLLAEAIPGGDLPQALQTDPSNNLSWIFANLDQAKWVPVLANLITECPPEAWPGLRPRGQLDLARPVLTLEEFTASDYRRSGLYNEFFRPLKLEQGVLTQIREEGALVGFYPLYRTAAMKPFDRDELRFLASAAPHIAHGLRTSRLIEALPCSTVEPLRSLDTSPGMVVMDKTGRILGLDERARSLFFQVGLYDGLPEPAFAEGSLRSILDYVARTLRGIFDDRERATGEFAAPLARIMSHKAGIALRLRAHATPGERGHDLFVVLVEPVEPEALARRRLMYRYGLAPREAEVLVLLRDGLSAAVRHLIEKFSAANLSKLRSLLCRLLQPRCDLAAQAGQIASLKQMSRLAQELGISAATAKTYVNQNVT